PAAHTRFAFTGKTDACAVLDARRDGYLQRFFLTILNPRALGKWRAFTGTVFGQITCG
ncbi:MAG: hypothetical protein K0R10_584, partial [Alphaproteobacteria bacterium]|nr:hypothetical protein [Alphaproteobacteria bacterium]